MTTSMYIYLSEFNGSSVKRSNNLQYAYMVGFVELNPAKSPRYRVSRLGKESMEKFNDET